MGSAQTCTQLMYQKEQQTQAPVRQSRQQVLSTGTVYTVCQMPLSNKYNMSWINLAENTRHFYCPCQIFWSRGPIKGRHKILHSALSIFVERAVHVHMLELMEEYGIQGYLDVIWQSCSRDTRRPCWWSRSVSVPPPIHWPFTNTCGT